jgi:glycine/D-amino acid oxidase-like deaminating enzyme
VLGAVRPSGSRRSWWLREALAAESSASSHLASATPPLRGTITADVVIVGAGYTGLWTALRVSELEPGARVVLLEADICGGGPSGRNGGFVTNWWDEFGGLLDRYGAEGAIAVGQAIEDAVDEVGAFCATNGVDAWFTKAGALSVSAAPAQDGVWNDGLEVLRGHGLGDRVLPLTAEQVAERIRSPAFREGVFMRDAATVQPAVLARALRRVALERGVVIAEGSEVVEIDGQRPGRAGRPRRAISTRRYAARRRWRLPAGAGPDEFRGG